MALENEVLDRLEFSEEGDGVSYEVWIDNTTNETYVIPITIVRHWADATKQ